MVQTHNNKYLLPYRQTDKIKHNVQVDCVAVSAAVLTTVSTAKPTRSSNSRPQMSQHSSECCLQ